MAAGLDLMGVSSKQVELPSEEMDRQSASPSSASSRGSIETTKGVEYRSSSRLLATSPSRGEDGEEREKGNFGEMPGKGGGGSASISGSGRISGNKRR